MLGAAIGDIAGSVYEWNNIKYKPEKLIKPDAVLRMIQCLLRQ